MSSEVPGEVITAAVGWALPENREKAGVIMEVHDKTARAEPEHSGPNARRVTRLRQRASGRTHRLRTDLDRGFHRTFRCVAAFEEHLPCGCHERSLTGCSRLIRRRHYVARATLTSKSGTQSPQTKEEVLTFVLPSVCLVCLARSLHRGEQRTRSRPSRKKV